MMENTAAVCTGAEQQYMISWSQQRRIWCLFKIRGGRGRKWLAPVVIFERRGSSGLRKMGSRWLVSVHPVRVKAKDQLPRDTGPGLPLTRGIFGWSQKYQNLGSARYLSERKPTPEEVHSLKVNACVLVNNTRMLLT